MIGAFKAGDQFEDSISTLMGVFSGVGGFIIPGPLGTIYPTESLATCPRNIPTDIPYDFNISNGTTVYAQVPEGATSVLFSPNDCYFKDNADPNGDFGVFIRVTVVSKPTYSIQKIPLNFSGDPNLINITPSTLACGNGGISLVRTLITRLVCLEEENNEVKQVGDCRVRLHLSDGIEYGGHLGHLTVGTDQERWGTLSTPNDYILIPVEGLVVTYTAPERSGAILNNISALDPNGSTIVTTNTVISAKIKDLIHLNIPGLEFQNINSHPGEGTYGTNNLQEKMIAAMTLFKQLAIENDIPEIEIPTLKSEGASLSWGGLFDINQNWHAPHCSHRNGTDIDISMSPFTNSPYKNQLKLSLQKALSKNQLSFPVTVESPSNISATHWHTRAR